MKPKTLFVLLFLISSLSAQTAPAPLVSVTTAIDREAVVAGESVRIAVILNIAEGMHINSNKPEEDYYIPTQISWEASDGLSFGAPQFPPAIKKRFSFSKEKLSIFEGRVTVIVPVSVSPNIATGAKEIRGTVSYQGCNDTMCFPPEEIPFELTFDVVPAGTPVKAANEELFADDKPSKQIELTAEEEKALSYLERGLPAALLAFFLVGLALNLTPCVYPVIPLTVAYFGGRRSAKPVAAVLYLTGIALSFAGLGLLSGLAGKQWGFLFQSPWFVAAVSVIILLMAASLFGAFEILVPAWLLSRAGRTREGSIGALFMGLTAGVIVAPCAAGIIIGLVGLVAKFGLVFKGALFFFFMGLGLGLPYLILALFGGLIGKLPQSGSWMLWVKKVFAFLLIGVALYFLLPQLERIDGKLGFLFGITAVTAGLLLGFLEHGDYSKSFNAVRRVLGLLFILFGIWSVKAGVQPYKSPIDWVHYSGQPVETLTVEKPLFIDFYADWCAPCKQLDRITFTDPKVAELSRSFTMLKVDCTSPDEATKRLMEQFSVTGMPTLVFVSAGGRVLNDLREIGFVLPGKFVESMKRALNAE